MLCLITLLVAVLALILDLEMYRDQKGCVQSLAVYIQLPDVIVKENIVLLDYKAVKTNVLIP